MSNAVFVPGLLCTGELYAPQIEVLTGLDSVVGDHRTAETMSEIARGILETTPDRFVLFGLSMGGYVSFEIMRQAGERVQALVLLDTGARSDDPAKTEQRKALVTQAQNEGVDPVVDQLTPHFLAQRHHRRDDLKIIVRRMAHDTGAMAFARQQRAIMTRPDSRPSLGAIACPTLVIVGNEDTLTPPEMAREICDGIPGAQLSVIEKCGHLATLEQPEAVTAAIRSFLEGEGIRS